MRHYAFTGRYDYTVDGDWTVQPAVMLLHGNHPIQLDLHARAFYQGQYWAKPRLPSGRRLRAVRRCHRDIQVGYAYDAGTGRVGNLSPNTNHRIYVLPRRGAFRAAGSRPHPRPEPHHPQLKTMMARLSLLVLIIASAVRRRPNSNPRRRRSRQQRRRSRTHLPCLCPDGGRRGCHRCRLWRWTGLPEITSTAPFYQHEMGKQCQ